MGFLSGSDGKESTCNLEDLGLITGLGISPGGGLGNPLQCSCLENPHGWRSLADYSPWCHKESDTTERLSTAQHMQKNPYSEQVIVKKLQICNQECTKIYYLDSLFFFFFNFFGHIAWHVGSQFLVQGLSPCLLHWKCGVLTTGLPENSLPSFF